MKKEIVEITLAEQKFVYGGCACKCKHEQPVQDEEIIDSRSTRHGHHRHHEDDHHEYHTYIPQTTFTEYTLGDAHSLSECSEMCLKNKDKMSSCLNV